MASTESRRIYNINDVPHWAIVKYTQVVEHAGAPTGVYLLATLDERNQPVGLTAYSEWDGKHYSLETLADADANPFANWRLDRTWAERQDLPLTFAQLLGMVEHHTSKFHCAPEAAAHMLSTALVRANAFRAPHLLVESITKVYDLSNEDRDRLLGCTRDWGHQMNRTRFADMLRAHLVAAYMALPPESPGPTPPQTIL